MWNKRTQTTFAASLLLALSVAPLAAQWREAPAKPANNQQDVPVKGEGRWSDLQLVIKDIDSGQDIGAIEPYGRVKLTERSKVRLIMTAAVPGNDKVIYPETVYSEGEKGSGGFRITKASRENANVTLQLVDVKGNGQRSERVSWQILDDRVPRNKQRGSFVIDVVSERVAQEDSTGGRPGPGGGYDRPPTNLSRPARMTWTLYRAILMREPDSYSQGFTDRIARDGYSGAVRAAVEIAQSKESREMVYRHDLTPEARLRALYSGLLGLENGPSDRRVWEEDLRRIQDNKVATVVDEMVRSQRFRELHGW